MSIRLEDITQSISELSDAELLERVKALRNRRDHPPVRATRAKSKRAKTKAMGLKEMIACMSPEDKKKLFLNLTGGGGN